MQRATLTACRPLRTPVLRLPSLCPASPPTRTQHDGTWYGIPCSVWPGWVSPPGFWWKLTLSWPNPGQVFISNGAQVCANGRSWTTTIPGLPTPSDSFPVGTFFFQGEVSAKVADTCCLTGKTMLVSTETTLCTKFVCFVSRYCHKRQWQHRCMPRAPLKKLLLPLLWSRFWSEHVQSPL